MKKIIMLVMVGVLAACTGNIGANQYETSAAGQISSATAGEIINVRVVNVSSSNGAGELAGGIAGAAAGSMIGGNTAMHVIGGVGGAVLGGILGNAAQENLSSQSAYEYVVKLDNGKAITLMQGMDVELKVGQKVYVLDANLGHRARIIPR